ncbi:hypothetical protein CYMTET_21822 [Cymbomonas tetramitiformis]|uniref:Uncharacterized protein n=1 Tax=Cymbomonas tetramitiformis TaxID=36881 RepID=A0AAE0L2L6_9CHLO|nr:hypothetical protein CYMTET_21822 [Cymbomonas tetramitiformis]
MGRGAYCSPVKERPTFEKTSSESWGTLEGKLAVLQKVTTSLEKTGKPTVVFADQVARTQGERLQEQVPAATTHPRAVDTKRTSSTSRVGKTESLPTGVEVVCKQAARSTGDEAARKGHEQKAGRKTGADGWKINPTKSNPLRNKTAQSSGFVPIDYNKLRQPDTRTRYGLLAGHTRNPLMSISNTSRVHGSGPVGASAATGTRKFADENRNNSQYQAPQRSSQHVYKRDIHKQPPAVNRSAGGIPAEASFPGGARDRRCASIERTRNMIQGRLFLSGKPEGGMDTVRKLFGTAIKHTAEQYGSLFLLHLIPNYLCDSTYIKYVAMWHTCQAQLLIPVW